MTTGGILCTTVLLAVILVAKIIVYLLKSQYEYSIENLQSIREVQMFTQKCACLLERSFSFIEIVDSKFIGLAIFMISNYFTGIVNLLIKTRAQNAYVSFLIIILNSIVFTLLPFFVYYKNIQSAYEKHKKLLVLNY